jgi:uncharacterized repeat protein (TIGR01451 family)
MSSTARRSVLLSLVIAGALGATVTALFNNGGFENGNFTGWTKSTFANGSLSGAQPYTGASITRNVGGVDWTTVEGGPSVAPLSLSDPTVGSDVQFPRFGHYVGRVNYAGGNYPNFNANAIVQQTTVTASDVDAYDDRVHIRFAYLPVVEDGGHAAAQQAYFYVAVKNVTQGNAVLYQRFTYANEAGVPWQIANGYQFTDWQVVDVAPDAANLAVGDTIEIEVVASGCSQGGHGAWVYVDAFGSSIPGGSIVTSAASAVRPGDPLLYRFHVTNNGTSALDAAIAKVTVPAQTTFASVSDNRCSQAGGVVTCNFGSLAIGASVDFDVVVNVGGGASGAITLGNYSVEGTGYPALLGPAFNTTVDINANRPPAAGADSYTVAEDASLNISSSNGVLANDTDADAQAMTVSLMGTTAHGALVLNADGSFTYAPDSNFVGTDGFSYRATDGAAYSPVTTVTLTVTGVNDPPTATIDGYAATEDQVLTVAAPGVLGNDSDPEGQTLTAVLVSGPAHGALTLHPHGGFVYTPTPNHTGADSFTYRVSDGGAQSAPVTVTLAVAAVNDTVMSPTSGRAPGGVRVTITENGFGPAGTAVTVTIGGVVAPLAEVLNDTTISFVTPALPAGTPVDVVINIPNRYQMTLPAAYLPHPVPPAGVSTDTDTDGLPDEWELRYGLDPRDASDAGDDTDGDGVSNTDEFSAGSHPTGRFKRYFAEGLNHPRVATMVSLANAGAATTRVRLSFFRQDAPAVQHEVTLAGRSRLTVDTRTVAGLEQAAFGVELEASEEVVSERTMSWSFGGKGGATERAVAASTTWHFAEGATTGGFTLFYLLTNPDAQPATATVRFLPQAGAPVDVVRVIPPFARVTIPVDIEIPGLDEADLGASVTADRPIVVERSMYLSDNERVWVAGTSGTGLAQPATQLYFAEGAAGSFFDAWLLISNPGATDAMVSVRYVSDHGVDATTNHTVPAGRRITIRVVNDVPALFNSSFAMTVTSTNAAPIVAERAMWWQASESMWMEGHVAVGHTTPGTLWGTAEGFAAADGSSDSFVLIGNTAAQAGTVKLTALFDDGTPAIERSLPIAASGRMTVRSRELFPEVVGKQFSVVVESTGSTPVPVIVDHSLYWTIDGRAYDGGTTAPATRIR